MTRTHHLLVPLSLLAVACTTNVESDPEEVTSPPVWEEAPADAVIIGEGRTVSLPLTAVDADGGEVTVEAIAPFGVDAVVEEGELTIHAGYGAASTTVPIVLTDDQGEWTQIDLAIQVMPLGWVDYQDWTTAEGPEEREHATVLFHEESGSAYLFGGSGYYPQFVQMMDDFWRYDTATGAWSQITPTGDIPPPAGSRRFAGVHGSGEGLLFGGYEADMIDSNAVYRVKVENDTLAFELLEPAGPVPFARSLHGFVHDAQTDRYFAFGGVSGFIYGDTWMLEIVDDQAVWTQLETADAPTARYGFFYGFDEEAGRMILFSGAQGAGADIMPGVDTWALDVRADPPAWNWLTNDGPQGRRNGCGIWDPTGPRLVVFGGTPDAMSSAEGLHLFDARPGFEAWTTLPLANEPQVRSSGFGFSDGDRVYMGFGNDNGIYRDWGILGY